MNQLASVFVGFFPKITAPAPEWLSNKSVKQICSVSTCISDGPKDWVNQWKHNEFGFYDSETLAYQVIDSDPNAFDIYAYELFPFSCFDAQVENMQVRGVGSEIPSDFQFLGYDIVTRTVAHTFECSPLSCNDAAKDYAVNEYCLIPDLKAAYDAFREICADGTYEPGPYYLFAVHRKKRRA